MSLGDNIRTARIQKKLQQKELAELLSSKGEVVGNTTISNWENGTSKPDPDTISLLCEILNVDANYLLGFSTTQSDLEFDFMSQYKALFDKDERLTEDQKKFFIDFLEERHKEIDKELDKN